MEIELSGFSSEFKLKKQFNAKNDTIVRISGYTLKLPDKKLYLLHSKPLTSNSIIFAPDS
jgi:hypothetical protein